MSSVEVARQVTQPALRCALPQPRNHFPLGQHKHLCSCARARAVTVQQRALQRSRLAQQGTSWLSSVHQPAAGLPMMAPRVELQQQ